MKNIRILLDRYWEGETTLEEERALKAYFNSGEVADEFRSDAAFFQAMQREKQMQLTRKVIPMPVVAHWSVRRYASMAAAVLLLLLAGWWMLRKPATPATDVVQQTIQKDLPQQNSTLQTVDVQVNKAPNPQQSGGMSTVKKVKKRIHKSLPKDSETEVVVHSTSELDPETRQALEEVRAALALVSSKISKGKKTAAQQINHVETLDKFIKKKGDI